MRRYFMGKMDSFNNILSICHMPMWGFNIKFNVKSYGDLTMDKFS